MKNNLYKIIVFCVVVLSVLGGGAFYIHEKQKLPAHPMSIPPDYYYLEDPNDIYSKTGIVSIAGRDFKIPVAYVQGNFKNGRIKGTVLLKYVLPDYKSILEFRKREEREGLIENGLVSGLLLEEASTRPSLEKMYYSFVDQKKYFRLENKYYGFDKYRAPKADGRYAEQPRDMYLKHDQNGVVTDLLFCSAGEQDVVPVCDYKFINSGILFDGFVSTQKLQDWNNHKSKIVEFIRSFENNDH